MCRREACWLSNDLQGSDTILEHSCWSGDAPG
jgi:hypothetical protein